MLDVESLIWERLNDLDGVWVSSENDPSIVFPAVVYSVSGEGQSGNGPNLWRVNLTVNVSVSPADYGIVDRVYNEIKSWAGRRSPSGHVTSVVDTDLMSRSGGTNVNGKQINTYTGAFALIAHI